MCGHLELVAIQAVGSMFSLTLSDYEVNVVLLHVYVPRVYKREYVGHLKQQGQ